MWAILSRTSGAPTEAARADKRKPLVEYFKHEPYRVVLIDSDQTCKLYRLCSPYCDLLFHGSYSQGTCLNYFSILCRIVLSYHSLKKAGRFFFSSIKNLPWKNELLSLVEIFTLNRAVFFGSLYPLDRASFIFRINDSHFSLKISKWFSKIKFQDAAVKLKLCY